MTKRRRRRHRSTSPIGDVLKLIFAIAMIAVAVVLVVFVYGKIRDTSAPLFGGGSAAESSAEEGQETGRSEAQKDGSGPLADAQRSHPGFHVSEDGRTYYLPEEGADPLKDAWLDEGGRLYYFDRDGYMKTGTYTESGMRYTFAEDGAVKRIQYQPDYQPDAASVNADYPSLVSDKKLWTYLLKEKKQGSYYALMYKKTTDPMPHQLGGEENPQYTGPYSMQLDGGYIYFLKKTAHPTEAETGENGSIYRMKPGSTVRELAAEDAEGFKVLGGVVYYDAEGKLNRTTTFTEDVQKKTASADTDGYYVDITEGDRAYLRDSTGAALTFDASESKIKVGNFTYKTAEDGEILDVQAKTRVNKGGYTYAIESSQLFGSAVSRVVREDKDGVKEVISSEFEGTAGNLHYDAGSGAMFAEYEDKKGNSHILRISMDGDADLLTEHGDGSGRLLLYAFEDGEAVCKEIIGADSRFITLDLSKTAPLAVSIDPVQVITDGGADGSGAGTGSETDKANESKGETLSRTPETEAALEAPPAETKQTAAAPDQKKGEGAAEMGKAPAASKKEEAAPGTAETGAELMGPGTGALVGGAPS